MRRVRLGVVGLGTAAQAVHLPLVTRRRDLFEVTAVCDLSAELAEQVTGRFGLGQASRHRSVEGLLDGGRGSRLGTPAPPDLVTCGHEPSRPRGA